MSSIEAEKPKVESIKLHLENLLPGLLLVAALALLVRPSTFTRTVASDLKNWEFVAGSLFIAAAYACGVLSATVSRGIVDTISERTVRPIFLMKLSHYEHLTLKDGLGDDSVPEAAEHGRSIREETNYIAWNELYRALLRYTNSKAPAKVRDEVARRREQGRLLRGLSLPVSIAVAAICTNMFAWSALPSYALASLTFFLCVVAYAYSEYFTFAEAALHVPKVNVKSAPQWTIGRVLKKLKRPVERSAAPAPTTPAQR